MEEKVQILVKELQDIVRKQTKSKYPDVNNAVTSLQDYVQDTTASKSGVEDRIRLLEKMLAEKSEKTKKCTEHIEKIRTAMRMQRKATPKVTRTKEEKRKPSSPAPSERTTPLPSKTKQMKTLSNPASPAPGGRVSHVQGQIIYVQPSSKESSPPQTTFLQAERYELTQTDETTELSGTIEENEERYQDEMADEVRFFMECLNGLKKVLNDDIKNPLEKIIPVAKGKMKKKVETGYKYIIDVAGDIRRLKTENQYLRKNLDGLHEHIIGGDEAALNELKKSKHMKDSQSIVEVEANVKEVTQKYHETKMDISRLETENQYLKKTLDGLHEYIIGGDERALNELKKPKHMTDKQSIVEVEAKVKEVTKKFHETKTNAENVTEESECLFSAMECLISHVQGLSDGNTESDISSALIQILDQIKSSVKKESPANQFLTQAKEIIGIQMEWKREAEYATHLIEELNKRLVYDGKQDTQIGLKEPPVQMARASSKDGKKGHKKQIDEKPKSRHSEQLQSNFSKASNVLKILMNTEESIAERKCLLSTLKCLCNYVRDLFEGKTEAETSPSWDEIWSSIKKESSANQGLSHAKEILSYQTEWKREAEYASNLLEQLNDFATNDGKDRQVILKEPVIPMAHDSRIDAKTESKKQTDQPPRSRHVEQLQRNFSNASKVLKKQMDAENAVKERECLLLALDCLFKHSQDLSEGTTEGDILSTLDQIKSSINKESPANQGLSHVGAILNIHMEWKREVEYVACLLEELAKVSQSSNNGGNCIILSHPENCGTSWGYKTKDAKNTESSRNKPMKSVQNEKLMRHYENASFILKQMKEKEDLRIDLGKRTEQVKDLTVRCKKLQEETNEIKNDADSLRTRLSEHAGALLTYDNPSIADLSDPNRPTKLSEMYSELYDNQWTDAFANIAKKDPDISDNTIVGYLYDMLVDGYRFCEDVRQTQKSSLEDILFYPAGGMKTSQRRQKEEISTIFAKHLSDVAKLSSNVSSAHIAKAFVINEKTKDKYRKMIKLCETYIQKCVQLCWLMQVQTPPLYLDLKTIEGQAFNKICYKEYTKKGKKIAFVVWPALFLHENGPLLSKGVAQCQ